MIALLLAAAAEAPLCHGAGLDRAVARYALTAKAMNPRRTARLYTIDGVLVGPKGEPISGPVEIEAFLAGFGGYKLGEQVMTIDATSAAEGGGWRTDGVYRQRGNDPKGAAFEAGGRFRAEWRCTKAGWRVARMQTFPGG